MSITIDYNYKSIVRIPARALKPKKIFLGAFFLLVALFFYDICTYLAFAAEGKNLGFVFDTYGFFPLKLFCFDSFLAAFFYYYLGTFLTGLTLLTGLTAIAIVDIEEVRGNPFMSFRKALSYGLSKIKQNFLAELAIAVFVAFIVLLFLLFGLIARTPYLGEFIYSVFFFFPGFIISILTTIVIFGGVLSALIIPAATALDRNGETFNSLLELFLTVTRQPIRWILYTAYSLIAAKICSFIFAYFAYRGIQLLKFAAALGGGEKINDIIASGMNHLPWQTDLVSFINNIFPGISFGFDISSLTIGTTGNPAGYLMAISLFLVFLTVCGYFFSVIGTGQAYSLIVLKYIREEHKVGDEKPLFFEEEYMNPPLQNDQSANKEP